MWRVYFYGGTDGSVTYLVEVWVETVAIMGEQGHQLRMHEEFLPAKGLFAQHTNRCEGLEVAGRRLALYDIGLNDAGDAAVRLLENKVTSPRL